MTTSSSSIPENTPDAALMARLAAGEIEALGVLAQRHQYRARMLAYRVVTRWDVADDIVQQAFLRLYHGAGRYTPTAAFTTWFHRIVVNLCLDWSRRRRIRPLGEMDHPAGEDHPAADPFIREEKLEAVRREVADLPDRQRMALVLHRFEGLSHSEIAHLTGWSEGAVESLLVRAYGRLRERLRDWADS